MFRINKLWLFLLMLISMESFSQNYINSPYTRYKIGDMIDNGFAYNKALGGSSIALRPHNQINYLNPASYTNQDTSSFLLQVGFTGRSAKIFSGIDNDKTTNFNIDFFAVGFPVTKWWNISVGAVPFSRIQYFVREEIDSTVVGENITFDYSGFGGFNEFYIGNAFEIGKILSVGVNAGYLFGSLDRKQLSYLSDLDYYSSYIEHKTSYIAGDFYFKLGAQFHPVINEVHKFVLGVTYDFKSDINVKLKGKTTRFNEFGSLYQADWAIDTLHFNIDTLDPLILPEKISVGLSYTYKDKLTATLEYKRQDWSGTDAVNSNFKAGLYESYRFGIEVIPVPLSSRQRSNYLQRINYRAGGFYSKTYLNFNNNNIKYYGISGGLSLPIKTARKAYTGTSFDIGYQYGIRGTTNDGLVKEKISIITFGLTLHDFWFLKPKYD